MSGKYFQTINGKKVDLDVKYKGFPWDEKAGKFYEGWGATKYSPKDPWVETLETQYTYNEDQKVTVIKPGTHPTFYIKDTISTDVTKTFKDTKAWVNCSGEGYSLVTVSKGIDNEKKECLKINYYVNKEDKTPANITYLYAGDFQDNCLPTRLLVLLQGAGGGGGSGTTNRWGTGRGAGGGSGGYWFGIIRFDDTISKIEVELGKGGNGGCLERKGADGTDTILRVYRNNLHSLSSKIVTLFGGKGGDYNQAPGSGGGINYLTFSDADNNTALCWTLGYSIGKAGGKKNKKGTDFSDYGIKLSCTKRYDLKEEIRYQTYLTLSKTTGGEGLGGGGGGASLLAAGGNGGEDGGGYEERLGNPGEFGSGGGGGGDRATFSPGLAAQIAAAIVCAYSGISNTILTIDSIEAYQTAGGKGGDAVFALWA